MGYLRHWITFIFMTLTICAAQIIANIPSQYEKQAQSRQAQYLDSANNNSPARVFHTHSNARSIPNPSHHTFPADPVNIEKKQKKSGWQSRFRSTHKSIDNKRLAFKAWLKKCWSKHPYIIFISIWTVAIGLTHTHSVYEKYMGPIREKRFIQNWIEEQNRDAETLRKACLICKEKSKDERCHSCMIQTDTINRCPVCFGDYNPPHHIPTRLYHIKDDSKIVHLLCKNCEHACLFKIFPQKCPICKNSIAKQPPHRDYLTKLM